MLNVRLASDEEKALERYCLDNGVSKSTVVKEALVTYLAAKKKAKSSFEAGKDLFGKEGSGISDLSVTFKKRLKQKLNEKHTG